MTFLYPTTPPILPPINGLSVNKKPVFASVVSQAVSGRETTAAIEAYPLWEFELTYEVLRTATDNTIPDTYFTGYSDYERLLVPFLAVAGQYGRFYYDDPTDNSRLGQVLGTGDGATTTYRILRTIGLGALALSEPVGGLNTSKPWTVYLDAVDDTANWSVGDSSQFLVRSSAVPADKVITLDFFFYYFCRFLEDLSDFEQFYSDRWSVKSLKFRSVKDNSGMSFDISPAPPGPSWHVYELDRLTGYELHFPLAISRDGTTAVGQAYDFDTGTSVGPVWNLSDLSVYQASAPPTVVAWALLGSNEDGTVWSGAGIGEGGFWTSNVFTQLSTTPDSNANFLGMSNDGSVIAGHLFDSGPACYWTTGGGGAGPFTLPSTATFAFAFGIADDNVTICGSDTIGGLNTAVKWVSGVKTALNQLVGGTGAAPGQTGAPISADGTIVVGQAYDSLGVVKPVYWTGTTITVLPQISGSDESDSKATGISIDKTVICGNSTDSSGTDLACVWRSGVLEELPFPVGSVPGDYSRSQGIAGDGNTVVGDLSVNGEAFAVVWKYF